MNIERVISETKEYIHNNLNTFQRGDLHTVPQVHGDDLMRYLQTLHNRFPRSRFLRFVRKMKSRRLILETSGRSLVFDPTFLY